MLKLFFLIFGIFFSSNVYAAAPDIRISDNDGHVLNINSDGTVPITGGGFTSPADEDLDMAGFMIEDNAGAGLDFDPDDDGTAEITFSTTGGITATSLATASGTGLIASVTGLEFDPDNDGSSEIIFSDSGLIGIGFNDQSELESGRQIQIAGDNQNNIFTIDTFSNTDGQRSVFAARKAAGTRLSKAAVASGDLVGFFQFLGWDGDSYVSSGGLTAQVEGAVSDGTVPIELYLQAGTTTNTTRMSINSDGAVGIGNIAPSQMFVVNPPTAETIAAAATITVDACGTIKRIQSTGNVTTNTTNTFTAPAAANSGCCMDVVNIDTVDTITLDNNANFFSAAAADVALGPGDSVRVCSSGTSGAWYQIGATGNN